MCCGIKDSKNMRDTVSEQYLAKMGFLRDDYLNPFLFIKSTEVVVFRSLSSRGVTI